ncbi:tyrosine-type recombinase/integrase [Nucisporomicrobium flavum]|uniref:tyrosine-type recombinase/integrase n=1 Tax=Nucisporomicrobium flavum TaxID=2785915 RepID=UPI0027DCC99F|nr:tyrosine-type recombinase/integrase [Nucisporomicrobium flavum]
MTRLVFIPDAVRHLAEFTGGRPDSLLFVGPKKGPLRRSNFQEHWRAAIEKAGVPGLHFHDLRHTGNTWAAETGATLRDLMDRMGHSTTRAALIYLHKKAGRDRKIADALGKLVKDARGTQAEGTEGHASPEGHAGGTAAE